MIEYTFEELISLSDMFLKTQFAAQFLFMEIEWQEKLEAVGKSIDDLAVRRLCYLGDIYWGFTSELINFFSVKKDLVLLSRLNSTKEQRSRLNAMRNSVFHITNSKLKRERFKKFKEVNKGWKLMFIKDFKIIGNYIFELHKIKKPSVALYFKNCWIKTSPFDLSK